MRYLSQITLGFVLFLIAHSVTAQKVYEGMIYIKQNIAEASNDTLYFDMDVNIQGLKVNSNESLSLYPVIFNANDSLELPPIVLNGSKKHQQTERVIALKGNHPVRKEAFVILKNEQSFYQIVEYNDTLTFKPWMKGAGLKLNGLIKDKNEKEIQRFSDILTNDLKLGK